MKGFDDMVTEAVDKVILSIANISEVKLSKDVYFQNRYYNNTCLD